MKARRILGAAATLVLLFHGPIIQSTASQVTSTNASVQQGTGLSAAPAREAWRLRVEPYAVLGSGRPGAMPADIDKPDGVEFAPSGLLLVTDSGNRRVQVWNVKTATLAGYFCSPDEIAAHTDAGDGETCVAIADQCNYRILVYRWSDIQKTIEASTRPSPK